MDKVTNPGWVAEGGDLRTAFGVRPFQPTKPRVGADAPTRGYRLQRLRRRARDGSLAPNGANGESPGWNPGNHAHPTRPRPEGAQAFCVIGDDGDAVPPSAPSGRADVGMACPRVPLRSTLGCRRAPRCGGVGRVSPHQIRGRQRLRRRERDGSLAPNGANGESPGWNPGNHAHPTRPRPEGAQAFCVIGDDGGAVSPSAPSGRADVGMACPRVPLRSTLGCRRAPRCGGVGRVSPHQIRGRQRLRRRERDGSLAPNGANGESPGWNPGNHAHPTRPRPEGAQAFCVIGDDGGAVSPSAPSGRADVGMACPRVPLRSTLGCRRAPRCGGVGRVSPHQIRGRQRLRRRERDGSLAPNGADGESPGWNPGNHAHPTRPRPEGAQAFCVIGDDGGAVSPSAPSGRADVGMACPRVPLRSTLGCRRAPRCGGVGRVSPHQIRGRQRLRRRERDGSLAPNGANGESPGWNPGNHAHPTRPRPEGAQAFCVIGDDGGAVSPSAPSGRADVGMACPRVPLRSTLGCRRAPRCGGVGRVSPHQIRGRQRLRRRERDGSLAPNGANGESPGWNPGNHAHPTRPRPEGAQAFCVIGDDGGAVSPSAPSGRADVGMACPRVPLRSTLGCRRAPRCGGVGRVSPHQIRGRQRLRRGERDGSLAPNGANGESPGWNPGNHAHPTRPRPEGAQAFCVIGDDGDAVPPSAPSGRADVGMACPRVPLRSTLGCRRAPRCGGVGRRRRLRTQRSRRGDEAGGFKLES